MLPNEHIHALLFLSLSRDEMSEYLPETDTDYRYSLPTGDGPDLYDFPSEAALLTCKRSLELYSGGACPDLAETQVQVLREIVTIIEMLFWVGRSSKYPFAVDKRKLPIEGPFDLAWDVMRRLSRMTLSELKLDVNQPIVPFDVFIAQIGCKRVAAPWPTSDDNEEEHEERGG